ncbi:hypothetical protein WJX73_005940 [Symbiochloris irregularis]|uniref:Uncharacterized protein n=1 Tax=Symbiochloris irregularis TaxID=706552 RepID=A0AAW1PVA7_9CHLO
MRAAVAIALYLANGKSYQGRSRLSTLARLEGLLDKYPYIAVAQVQGAGRGLVAQQAISQGQLVFKESPLLSGCLPSQYEKVCHHCLRALGFVRSGQACTAGGRQFCSKACAEHAALTYMPACLLEA